MCLAFEEIHRDHKSALSMNSMNNSFAQNESELNPRNYIFTDLLYETFRKIFTNSLLEVIWRVIILRVMHMDMWDEFELEWISVY